MPQPTIEPAPGSDAGAAPAPVGAAGEAIPARGRPSLADAVAIGVASAGGAGFSPVAPGTVGTLVAIPLFVAVAQLAGWLQLALTAAAIVVAIAAAHRAGRWWGNHDDQRIVLDEVAGYLVTMALVPPAPAYLAAGFVLFRIFDILKPWPVRYFDRRFRNAYGNVLDDVCAGLFARACMVGVMALG
jgi:phosphatidylglycerophosphatase A